jgi:hypothetical protein
LLLFVQNIIFFFPVVDIQKLHQLDRHLAKELYLRGLAPGNGNEGGGRKKRRNEKLEKQGNDKEELFSQMEKTLESNAAHTEL